MEPFGRECELEGIRVWNHLITGVALLLFLFSISLFHLFVLFFSEFRVGVLVFGDGLEEGVRVRVIARVSTLNDGQIYQGPA